MRKAGLIAFCTLALLAIAGAAYVWVTTLVNSMYGYSSPLKGSPPVTEDSSSPLTAQVVLVLIDGLRDDVSQQMPYLNTLRKQGAYARLESRYSSGSQGAWTTLLSGARTEINGAPLFDPQEAGTRAIAVDQIFAAAQRVGLTTGIAGNSVWEKLVAADALYTRFFTAAQGDEADRQVVERATVFLSEFRPNLLLVQLSQVDQAGTLYGATSEQYLQAALRCDEYLRSLAQNVQLDRSVLIVVSGHGQLDRGGHGGDEAVLLTMPFVMAGQGIIPGDYRNMDLADVAPTVATLLGAPIPSAAQGGTRLDMLRMGVVTKAERLVALADQRVHIGNIYLFSIGPTGVGETAQGDMQVAASSLLVKNYESTAELAGLAVKQTNSEMAQKREQRIWLERRQRAVPAALALLVLLYVIWHYASRRTLVNACAAVLAGAAYHVLALQQGSVYSLSRMPPGGLAATLQPSARNAALAVALGALVVVWDAWRRRERSSFEVAVNAYGYVAFLLSLIGLVVGACTVWNGQRFTWYLPNLKVAYIHFAMLMQLMFMAALSIIVPPAVALVQRGCLLVSDRLAQKRSH